MYKSIRKKVAASVNSVDAPEQFEWSKWLRASEPESLSIDKISSSTSGKKVNLSFDLPETNSYTFLTKKVKLFKSRKLASFPKGKTIKVFYKLSKSATPRKIKIFEADSGKIIYSSDFDKKSDSTDVIREIIEPLSKLNFKRETKENSALLSSKTTIPINFHPSKPKLKELSLIAPSSNNIDIKVQIKKPESRSYFEEIYFFLEKSRSENIYQPAFNFLNEIPQVDNLNIQNVYHLIEQLDKDETSKRINIIPIQFLDEHPPVQKVDISNYKKTNILHHSNQVISGNNISTYTYLFQMDKPKIPGESFEKINKDKLFENWNIPLGADNTVLNPQQGIEENEKIPSKDTFEEEVEKVINDDSFEKTISNILEPGVIPPEKISISEEYLYSYQKQGAELLAGNKNALLCDESGLGKSYQAIAALKSLYNINAVNRILIVCNPGDIGEGNFNEGWAGKLNELQAGIPFKIVNRNDEENVVTWTENKNIFITNYDIFFQYLNQDNSKLRVFENFNCLIFDEAQNLIPNQKLLKRFLEIKRKIKPYIWFLSDQLNFSKRIQKEVNYLKNFPIIELGRSKTETYRELSDVVRQDVWHELDDEQIIEYENILSVGRERISKLLQNGNPFIIQSNVFTLLHQLKQIYNFASQKNSSAKSEHLLKQIENVIQNDKKILVFSQYDKMGVQKIEKILNTNKIKYILLHSGMSLNELEGAKKKFKTNEKIHVLLNGIKSSRTVVNLPEVQYAVHFDQWWNPATVWKGEANINRPANENINVYNYFTKNTVEEKIKNLLQKKGLLRKEVIEFVSAESINEMVSLDEWLEILGVNNSSKNTKQNIENENKGNHIFASKLNELSINELSKKTEMLFSRLGYKNLSLNKGKYEGEINIIGTILDNNSKIKMVAKCLFSPEVDLETITDYIESVKNDKNQGKNFIIHFNGLEEKLPYHLKKKLILINKDLFTNYLINFRLI